MPTSKPTGGVRSGSSVTTGVDEAVTSAVRAPEMLSLTTLGAVGISRAHPTVHTIINPPSALIENLFIIVSCSLPLWL